ncbi:lipoprotein signal peptidase [Flavobacteriales bacterium]|nr:lipoprotein signal peptidase [Flavobacteriales bacterium]MDC1063220.1 lipoprotein signal peptidase [Flavobacteriales bacterium]
MKKVLTTALLLLVVDQLSKFWIKTNMFLGQEFKIFDWFIIHFTENNGMAFGLEFGGDTGKIILSVFRIIVIVWGFSYITTLTKSKLPNGLLIALGLVFGGAIGNIIDGVFYGVLFNDSYNQIAEFLPAIGGYSTFLMGKVVDMFYFPIINTHFPNWVPIFGGDHFIFFRPVFNVADAGISVGMFLLILFYRKHFR